MLADGTCAIADGAELRAWFERVAGRCEGSAPVTLSVDGLRALIETVARIERDGCARVAYAVAAENGARRGAILDPTAVEVARRIAERGSVTR